VEKIGITIVSGMPRRKDNPNDSEDETPHKTTPKSNVNGLPVIRDISWVNSNQFESKKVILGDEEENGGVIRVQIKYKYERNGEQFFCLAPHNDSNAFFRSNGIEEETYLKRNGVRTGTGRNVMKFYLDKGNEEHEAFYKSLLAMCSIIKKKIEKKTGENVDIKIRGLYDVTNDKKDVTGYAISARFIENKAGEIYTAAYNDEGQVDIKSVGRCIARPALIYSYTVPDDNNYRINVSISQVYYKAQELFPLRDRD